MKVGRLFVCRVAVPILAVLTVSSSVVADPLPGADPLPPELADRIGRALAGKGDDYVPRTRHRTGEGRPLYTNRLFFEASPYLQQHAHNPVNWYAWGPEAFAAARKLDRPIFLSIGYSTCHWCHVMEEESFEDPEIAEFLNRHFIPIKVDREERPDVDAVYMEAVRGLTGRGGWPLSVFLTPDREPYYGGTYFPPRDGMRGRRAGFLTVMTQMRNLYRDDPERVAAASAKVLAALQASLEPQAAVGMPGNREIRVALSQYRSAFDGKDAGLGRRTKFPSSLAIPLLLRIHRRTADPDALRMAERTLDAMRRGGIYDHVGGGFHRYTVEPSWTIPHFEKMLYDNALLAVAYLEAYQLTGKTIYADVVRDVLAYLDRDMTADGGLFYAATDADSEGEEGTYFLWTPGQVREAVGPELAPLALTAYGVTDKGNFEGGRTVLRRDISVNELARTFKRDPEKIRARLAEIRAKLRAVRVKRVPPLTDTKQIVAWNGLAISAYARAGLVLEDSDLTARGARAADRILRLARPEDHLARYLLEGKPYGTGMLEDYAFFIAALLDLFEATADPRWIDSAIELQADLDARFFDDSAGGYYMTPSDGEALLVREKGAGDSAIPSGNSIEAMNLLRLYLFTTNDEYRMQAEMTVRAFSDRIQRSPRGFGRMLDAVDFMLDRPKEILILAPNAREEAEPFLKQFRQLFFPNRVLIVTTEPEIPALRSQVPLLEHKRALQGKTTAYVCENQVCDFPAKDPATFAKQIRTKPAAYPGEPNRP
jgi:uncharacterized protein YyaL (SSP411 family)